MRNVGNTHTIECLVILGNQITIIIAFMDGGMGMLYVLWDFIRFIAFLQACGVRINMEVLKESPVSNSIRLVFIGEFIAPLAFSFPMKTLLFHICGLINFIWKMAKYNTYLLLQCKVCSLDLCSEFLMDMNRGSFQSCCDTDHLCKDIAMDNRTHWYLPIKQGVRESKEAMEICNV
jgi:hypothetical protein